MLATSSFSATFPCCMEEWILVGMWSYIPVVAGDFSLGHSKLGRRGARCAWAGSIQAAMSCTWASSTPGRSELGKRRQKFSWPQTRRLAPVHGRAAQRGWWSSCVLSSYLVISVELCYTECMCSSLGLGLCKHVHVHFVVRILFIFTHPSSFLSLKSFDLMSS
jgi:hypothetical protein